MAKQILQNKLSATAGPNSVFRPGRALAESASRNLKELLERIRSGRVDTVLAVFPDMQGRWMGKRVTGRFFQDSVAESGLHACAYLLTADMEMEPLPGFDLTSWEKGYQDFHMVPDFATVRLLPWLEKTALVVCDLYTEDGKPVEEAPRTLLKRQIERAQKAGFSFKTGSELEFYLFKETYDSARQKDYHHLELFGRYYEDYHILQGSKEEFVVGSIRNLMEEAKVPVEFSKGEWGPGQHEINLRYANPLEMADRHTVYKHGAKEIAMSKGHCLTFMAKYDMRYAGSSFHLHSSLWDSKEKKNLFRDPSGRGASKTFYQTLAGQMALAREFSLFYAPSLNSYKRYQSASFAPTRIAWGHDNRTCGFRIVGEGEGFRIENRLPGADANPYLAFAAAIASSLYGIEKKLEPPKEFKGDAYRSGLPQVPKSLREAAAELKKSKAAVEAFGEAVVRHYLHAAEMEQSAFDSAVTCWELNRYFERI